MIHSVSVFHGRRVPRPYVREHAHSLHVTSRGARVNHTAARPCESNATYLSHPTVLRNICFAVSLYVTRV